MPRRESMQWWSATVLACGLLACAPSRPAAAAPDPLAAMPLPGATNAVMDPNDGAPLVSIVGQDVLVDGQVVGDIRSILSLHRLQRVDGVFVALRSRREEWGLVSTHLGRTFPGVVRLAMPDDTPAVVVKSVFQTAAFAGYPNAEFLVRTPNGIGSLRVDAQVPGPPGQGLWPGPLRTDNAGGLSPEQVRKVVMTHAGALRACYELEAQHDPNLKGGVVTTWQIDAHGVVSGPAIQSTTLNNPAVERCIVRQIASWVFPPSDAPTSILTYPFRFGMVGSASGSGSGSGSTP